MMRITHMALWVNDLEKVRKFYEHYFDGVSNEKYVNKEKGFESYFIRFDSETRLEIMSTSDVKDAPASIKTGWAHIAFSTGSKEKVDTLTEQLENDGYKILGGPRTTGDGYYESVVLDPEKNRVEITL